MIVNAIKNLVAECIWNHKQKLWITRTGRRIYFTEMTDAHLLNTLRMVEEGHKGTYNRQIWAELRLTVQRRGLKPLKHRSPEQIVRDQRAWEAGEKRILDAAGYDDAELFDWRS